MFNGDIDMINNTTDSHTIKYVFNSHYCELVFSFNTVSRNSFRLYIFCRAGLQIRLTIIIRIDINKTEILKHTQ